MQKVENQFYLGKVKMLDIATEFGAPVYVYDTNKIALQYKKLAKAFEGTKVKLNYACKALSNISILKYMHSLGSGLDAVSIQEIHLGLHAGFAPHQILFTPNCVSFEEIKDAVELGVRINIDSTSMLEQFGHFYGNTIPCCVRLNPHIMAGGNNHTSVGHADSKFGISIYQMSHVHRIVNTYKMKIDGLHMHTGSDILDADVFMRGAELLFEVATDFKDLEFIDFGSGFKVSYKEGDITTDIHILGQKLSEKFLAFCKNYGKELELWFEPGKFLVSESGYFLVRVNVIKQTTSTVFAGVDSGQNHLLRPKLYDAYHHITNLSNPDGIKRIYSVVGYICETDTFAWDRQISEIKEGDILCFHNAGAYGFSMSSNYNSRYRPAEVLIHKGTAHLIRTRESFDDLLKNQIECIF
jgi:diaminopimelate decarboxylase